MIGLCSPGVLLSLGVTVYCFPGFLQFWAQARCCALATGYTSRRSRAIGAWPVLWCMHAASLRARDISVALRFSSFCMLARTESISVVCFERPAGAADPEQQPPSPTLTAAQSATLGAPETARRSSQASCLRVSHPEIPCATRAWLHRLITTQGLTPRAEHRLGVPGPRQMHAARTGHAWTAHRARWRAARKRTVTA